MNYRFAEDKDKDAIMEILDLSFDGAYAYHAKKSFNSLGDSLVAEGESSITGVINWNIFDVNGESVGYLFWLAVHPGHRKKGTGEGLILEAIKQIQEKAGFLDIYSAVDKDNAPMRKLFGKLGFTPDGKSIVKRKYGMRRLQIYSQMMLMPWEDLFIKQKI